MWKFKRDEQNMNGEYIADVATAGSSSFKHKPSLSKGLNSKNIAANSIPNIAGAHRLFTNAKVTVPLK